MSQQNTFLNIFTYESVKNTDHSTFMNCVMSRDFDTLKKGDKLPWISVNLTIYGSTDDPNGFNVDCSENYLESQNNLAEVEETKSELGS
jgi:hypothetical protein